MLGCTRSPMLLQCRTIRFEIGVKVWSLNLPLPPFVILDCVWRMRALAPPSSDLHSQCSTSQWGKCCCFKPPVTYIFDLLMATRLTTVYLNKNQKISRRWRCFILLCRNILDSRWGKSRHPPNYFYAFTVVFEPRKHCPHSDWLKTCSNIVSDLFQHFSTISTLDCKMAANQKPAFCSRDGHPLTPKILLGSIAKVDLSIWV